MADLAGEREMLLAIDIGNTNIHFGLWDGMAWRWSWRARTVPAKTSDEYALLLRGLLTGAGVEVRAISAVCMSSVVPALTETFLDLSRQCFQLAPLNVSSETELGIAINIDVPGQAGADRLCNAVALAQHYGAPAVSVDFGTSTNFDVLSAGREYIGGVIAPGISLAQEALVSRAAQLHRVALEPPPAAIGRNTIHAMQSGLFWGYVGMIDALLGRILAQLDSPTTRVVATGGLAPVFMRHIPGIDALAPELTLDGLRLIYEMNAE